MKRGKLIVFEGIDGVGKATQAALLAKRIKASGATVKTFESPRYDLPSGRLVRRALMGEFGNFVALSPYISSLPYLVDFAAWRNEIVGALERGVVVCDRHVQSTIAYHAAKLSGSAQKKFLKEISRLAFTELKLPEPNLVFFLDVPTNTAKQLMGKRKKDQHEKDTAYQKKVAKIYRTLAKGKNWHRIECAPEGRMLSRKEIHEHVWDVVQKHIR